MYIYKNYKKVLLTLFMFSLLAFIGCNEGRTYHDVTGPNNHNPNSNPNHNPNVNIQQNGTNRFVFRRNGFFHWDYEKFAVNFVYSRIKYSFISSNTGGGYAKITFLDYNHNYIHSKGVDFYGDLVFEDIVSFNTLVRYIEITMSDYEGSIIISAESF